MATPARCYPTVPQLRQIKGDFPLIQLKGETPGGSRIQPTMLCESSYYIKGLLHSMSMSGAGEPCVEAVLGFGKHCANIFFSGCQSFGLLLIKLK